MCGYIIRGNLLLFRIEKDDKEANFFPRIFNLKKEKVKMIFCEGCQVEKTIFCLAERGGRNYGEHNVDLKEDEEQNLLPTSDLNRYNH